MDVERTRQLILDIIRAVQQANDISQNEMEDIISDVEFDFRNSR